MQRFVMPVLQIAILFYFKFFQSCTFNKSIQCFRGKDFPPGCKDHLFHIFPAHPEAPTTDTRDNFVFGIVLGTAGKAQLAKMLNTCHLIAGRAVILRDFRLDNDLWVELDTRGKILTVNSFHYIWNAPNQDWWPDWLGEVDNIHAMGYEDLYEGGTGYHQYSFQQNAGYAAGYDGNAVLMGMPSYLASWGTTSGRGTSAQAHVQEIRYDLAEPTGIAIWDLQLTAWQNSDLWCEIAELKEAGSTTPAFPFPQHVDYAPGTIRPNHRSQVLQDDDVRAFYDYWKAKYLVAAGTTPQGDPMYRVTFGSGNPDSTVSEGQGYGMVIVATMAGHDPLAKVYFDGLWEFSRAHPSSIDSRLMDWQVPENSGDDSAFDGDADIAYGLLLAHAQWDSSGRINYAAEAATVIAGILQSTIGPNSRLPMLGDWVSPNGSTYNQYTPRTSDFMLVNFRAYGWATSDPVWDEVVTNSQAVITSIQANHSTVTGLLPDFVVDADQSSQPAPPNFLEGANDGKYYYNAGRDPWRIGSDALLNNDPVSLAQVRKIANWIYGASGGDPANIKAGYELDGTPIGNYFSTFFVAPMGVAAMTEPSLQQFLNDIYDAVFNTQEDYYEDSVNLLALLVMTGNFWDPVESTLPEINVTGNSVTISDEDSSPSLDDHTDFGTAQVDGGSVVRTFTIENTGGADLTIGAISFSGTNTGDFSVTSSPASSIVPAGSTTFDVTFDPSGDGIRTADISIVNNDADENPYNFAIQGSGAYPPEINLTGNSVSILDGDTTPDASDHTDFGGTSVAAGTVMRTYTIENIGAGDLIIGAITFTGTHAADFSVSSSPSSPVAPSGSTAFDVTFNPSGEGTRSAEISIVNNDSDENPYNYAIQGTGITAPEINLTGNGQSIADGDDTPSTNDHTDFGDAGAFDTIVRTFTIENTGDGELTLGAITITGDISDFSETASPTSPVPSGGTTTFDISFSPTGPNLREATISITNNDSDENPYNFDISGSKVNKSPEMSVEGNSTTIPDGDTTPSPSDNTDFSDALVDGGTVAKTFTIKNTGSDPLAVGTISFTGAHAADFSVTSPPASSVAKGGGTTSFEVTFDPDGGGIRTSEISIVNDDLDENPYNFAIQGKGIIYGDVNGDGKLDLADAIIALQILGGIDMSGVTLSPDADCNGDGRIGIEEAIYILQKVSNLR